MDKLGDIIKHGKRAIEKNREDQQKKIMGPDFVQLSGEDAIALDNKIFFSISSCKAFCFSCAAT